MATANGFDETASRSGTLLAKRELRKHNRKPRAQISVKLRLHVARTLGIGEESRSFDTCARAASAPRRSTSCSCRYRSILPPVAIEDSHGFGVYNRSRKAACKPFSVQLMSGLTHRRRMYSSGPGLGHAGGRGRAPSSVTVRVAVILGAIALALGVAPSPSPSSEFVRSGCGQSDCTAAEHRSLLARAFNEPEDSSESEPESGTKFGGARTRIHTPGRSANGGMWDLR